MKKFLAIIALAGVFTACGSGTESSTETDSTSSMMSAPDTSMMMEGHTDSTMMMSDSTKH